MTEAQFLSQIGRLGGWALAFVLVVWIVANKIGPQWVAAWFNERKASRKTDEAERKARLEEDKVERQTVISLYERLVSTTVEMTKFIAGATEAIHDMSRSLDANTQQVYRLSQLINRES